MRASRHPAHFQDRRPDRRIDGKPFGKSDRETVVSLLPMPQLGRSENDPDQANPARPDPVLEKRPQVGALRIRWNSEHFHLLHPGGIGSGFRGRLHPRFGEAEQGANRDQDVSEQDEREGAPVPGVETQPKMQTNYKMSPNQENEKDLLRPQPGIDPKVRDLIGIVDLDPR
jgi:hypothetical protein